jgi:hypothetical protein
MHGRLRRNPQRDMACHLFTWGEAVKIVAADALKETMLNFIQKASA